MQGGADGDGLSGADLAGDHSDSVFGNAPADPRDGLAVGGVAVQHPRARSRPNGLRMYPKNPRWPHAACWRDLFSSSLSQAMAVMSPSSK